MSDGLRRGRYQADEIETMRRMEAAGASVREIADALRRPYQNVVAARRWHLYGYRPSDPKPAYAFVDLTPMQQLVALMVADGLEDGEIAARLGVTRSTVKGHGHRLRRRVGAANRVELARWVWDRLAAGDEPTCAVNDREILDSQ